MAETGGGSRAKYDVVIAGGGMVGASLGCALARLPLRVAVVEPFPFDSAQQPSFDLRTTALSRSTQRILASLDIWSEVASAAAPIRRIHVSEQGRFGSAVIDADEQGVDSLGYVLENRKLGAALWASLRAATNVDLISPGTIEAAEPGDTAIRLTASPGSVALDARLLAVADGARSRLRTALGIQARERDYGQSAVVGTLQASQPGDALTAYERFTPEGPLAVLPAGAGRYVFVLTRRAAVVAQTLALGDAEFIELLQRSFGFRLGRILRVGRRHAYPLSLMRADRITAQRAVLVGNAAHGLHPVAGQGYNLGLRDAAALAETIADAWRAGRQDAGAAVLLKTYADWRRADQARVVAFTDGLVRLFDLDIAGLGPARGLGLTLFDLLPGAKRELARQTMGLGGRVSRLARGLPL